MPVSEADRDLIHTPAPRVARTAKNEAIGELASMRTNQVNERVAWFESRARLARGLMSEEQIPEGFSWEDLAAAGMRRYELSSIPAKRGAILVSVRVLYAERALVTVWSMAAPLPAAEAGAADKDIDELLWAVGYRGPTVSFAEFAERAQALPVVPMFLRGNGSRSKVIRGPRRNLRQR